MRLLTTSLVLLLSLGISACTTAHKRAKELLEQELYDDALAAYGELLRQNPSDEEALDGQKKAREKWIDRRLIDVRLQRQAGNAMESLNRFLDIVERERDWKMAPGGKAAFTQGEERDYAIAFAEREVGQSLAAKRPLKAHVFLTRYAAVLEGEPDPRVARLRSATRQAGQESCKPWQSGKLVVEKFNLEKLLRRYCELWGSASWPPPKPGPQAGPPYYKSLEIKAALEGFKPDARVHLEDSMSKALVASAWYEPDNARAMPVSISGRYAEIRKEAKVQKFHVYTETEPYLERVQVQKSRTVPYTEVINGQPVTQYRSETYYEVESVTRHRTVHKEYPYWATQRDQVLSLELQGRFDPGSSAEIAVQDRSEATGIEHQESLPAIGLKPSSANLPDAEAWTRGIVNRLVSAFGQKLADIWTERFCATDPAGTDLFAAGEAVARCLRQRHAKAPEGAQQWFAANFGTSVEDGLRAIGYP